MTSVLATLDTLAKSSRADRDWKNPVWKEFIVTGRDELLASFRIFASYNPLPPELLSVLPAADQLDEHGKRLLQACIAGGHQRAAGEWLQQSTTHAIDHADEFAKGCALLLSVGCTPDTLAVQVLQRVHPLREPDGSPTTAGAFLLALDDAAAGRLLERAWHSCVREMARLFAGCDPDRWRVILETFLREGNMTWGTKVAWLVSLEQAPQEFMEPAARALDSMKDWDSRYDVGARLAEMDFDRYGPTMDALVAERLDKGALDDRIGEWQELRQGALWLVANRGIDALPALENYFAAPSELDALVRPQGYLKNTVLDAALETLGRDAIPLLDAAFATEQPFVQLRALHHWAAIRTPADHEKIAGRLRQLLAVKNFAAAARAVRMAIDLRLEGVEDDLWLQLSSKSKLIRDAASAALATLGESQLWRAPDLLSARRADTRVTVVGWLRAVGTVGTAGAVSILKSRLDDEEADDVRDAILLALEALDVGARALSKSELSERIEKALAKIDGPPVPWLDPTTLPAAKLTDGSTLSTEWLLYLLHRQSRVKDIRVDIEARPVFAQLNRDTTGELALAVIKAFLQSEMNTEDRWVLSFAAAVGDDRLVPVLARQVKTWADDKRSKLAEYGVQALALLGTDSALTAVDAMAIRYSAKSKNVGKAASDAFAMAADARGVSVQELGDLVVPWLGFVPGQPRIIDTGTASIEARINTDLTLTLRDVATNRKIAKLPAGTPAAVSGELKELNAALKEAVKAQLLRLEALMVRQFRWSVSRWEALYLQHPLLLPFAQSLVWGAYTRSGELLGSFRSLDDRTATDANDEAFLLLRDCEVGIMHPLELTSEARHRWQTHLADYDITPPFAQLERRVVAVTDSERNTRIRHGSAGETLNAMTFKSRAERLNWARGSVGDSGTIGFYYKIFPTAGVDVFLETEDMHIAADMNSDITLGTVFFVQHGTVRIGSYVSDEPMNESDPRLVAFGDVPPIVFSESMGDLNRIAGSAEAASEES